MTRALALIGLSLVTCMAGAADPLGRLFYTPAQRLQLDTLRNEKKTAPPAAEPEQPVPVPEVLRYDGSVRRSDGKTTVWINNRPVNDGKPTGELPVPSRVRPDHGLSLTLPEAGKNIELRVGQSVDVESGSVQEQYAPPLRDMEPAGTAAKPANAASPGDGSTARRTADDQDGERARR